MPFIHRFKVSQNQHSSISVNKHPHSAALLDKDIMEVKRDGEEGKEEETRGRGDDRDKWLWGL